MENLEILENDLVFLKNENVRLKNVISNLKEMLRYNNDRLSEYGKELGYDEIENCLTIDGWID